MSQLETQGKRKPIAAWQRQTSEPWFKPTPPKD